MPRGLVLANISICWAFLDTAAMEARWQYRVSSSGTRTHQKLGSIAQQWTRRRRSLDEKDEWQRCGARWDYRARRSSCWCKTLCSWEKKKIRNCKSPSSRTNSNCHWNRNINNIINPVFWKSPEPMLQVPATTPPTTLQRRPFAWTHILGHIFFLKGSTTFFWIGVWWWWWTSNLEPSQKIKV